MPLLSGGWGMRLVGVALQLESFDDFHFTVNCFAPDQSHLRQWKVIF